MKEESDQLSAAIIGAAIEVHRHLGPGLLESTYERALMFELEQKGLEIKRQEPVPILYKGHNLGSDYKLDLLVNDLVVVELKSIDKILPIHKAQLLTYLKLTKRWLGLLINFNDLVLKQGVVRVVN